MRVRRLTGHETASREGDETEQSKQHEQAGKRTMTSRCDHACLSLCQSQQQRRHSQPGLRKHGLCSRGAQRPCRFESPVL